MLRRNRFEPLRLLEAWILGGDLRAVVTYDQRMAAAAAAIGLPVEAPE